MGSKEIGVGSKELYWSGSKELTSLISLASRYWKNQYLSTFISKLQVIWHRGLIYWVPDQHLDQHFDQHLCCFGSTSGIFLINIMDQHLNQHQMLSQNNKCWSRWHVSPSLLNEQYMMQPQSNTYSPKQHEYMQQPWHFVPPKTLTTTHPRQNNGTLITSIKLATFYNWLQNNSFFRAAFYVHV